MLTHLHIEHFALIDDLDCTFKDNMNVILGETGAGKSILMQAIALMLGSKSDFEKIRTGEEKAYIEGEFILDQFTLNKIKDEYEDYLDDNKIIISRYLDIKGKSIQRVNGKSIPLSMLKKISKFLIDIHSPQEELFFYDEKQQINILDNFIFANQDYKNDEKYFIEYQDAYTKIKNIENKINDLNNLLSQDIDRDYLTYQLDELKNASIKENELEDLESEFASLSMLVNITSKLENFFATSSEGINSIFKAKKELESIKDDSFSEFKESYIDAYYALDEAHNNLEDHFKSLLESSSRIEEIKTRLYFLRSLKRKYGSSTKEMLDKMEEIEVTLSSLDEAEYNLNKLEKEKQDFIPVLLEKGEKLNEVRKKYAEKLSLTIESELKDLLFENATFKIKFIKDNYNALGIYKVQFLLSANKGMEALPLKDSISLGESSRLMLAFKKVFFDFEHRDTLIFDEIDVGVSGKAALAIGNKIKELSKLTQVLVISHLGQVSCKGDNFYLVKKEIKDEKTQSRIIELNHHDGIIEIAKMINNGTYDDSSLNLINSWVRS